MEFLHWLADPLLNPQDMGMEEWWIIGIINLLAFPLVINIGKELGRRFTTLSYKPSATFSFVQKPSWVAHVLSAAAGSTIGLLAFVAGSALARLIL